MFSITRYIYMLADIDAVDMDSVDVCNNVVTCSKAESCSADVYPYK